MLSRIEEEVVKKKRGSANTESLMSPLSGED